MKVPNSSFSEYFKRSVVFLIKTNLAVFATSVIEFVDLCTNVGDLTYQIFFYGKEYNYKNTNLSKILLAISPYQYFFNYISSDKTESFFTRNILFIIIYAVLFIWFLIYFLTIRNCNLDEMSALNKIIQKISINIFDFLLYRVIPLYAFDLIGREIMKACLKESADLTEYFTLFISLAIFVGLIVFHMSYYSKISIILK